MPTRRAEEPDVPPIYTKRRCITIAERPRLLHWHTRMEDVCDNRLGAVSNVVVLPCHRAESRSRHHIHQRRLRRREQDLRADSGISVLPAEVTTDLLDAYDDCHPGALGRGHPSATTPREMNYVDVPMISVQK